MLLDNQSMVDLFCNCKLLVNIHPSSTRMDSVPLPWSGTCLGMAPSGMIPRASPTSLA
jgi:hypothetical protein